MSSLIILIFILITSIKINAFDYCTLTCTVDNITIQHMVCERHNDCALPSYGCLNFQNTSLTAEDRTLILDAHNRLRNTAALGETTYALKLITAANMNQLKWDNELEYIALCWVNTCEVKTDDTICIDTQNAYSGYNIALKRISVALHQLNTAQILIEHINGWYSEVQGLSLESVERFPDTESFQMKFRHFSQIIWAKTTALGCARSIYGQYITMFVCVYNPGGNIEGEPVFKLGPPCSACYSGQCSSTYEGLCVVLETTKELQMTVAIELSTWTVADTIDEEEKLTPSSQNILEHRKALTIRGDLAEGDSGTMLIPKIEIPRKLSSEQVGKVVSDGSRTVSCSLPNNFVLFIIIKYFFYSF